MKKLASLLVGLITSGLIGGISLYSSPSSAQFGNLLKDLEKAAKDLEKGIQQGAQPKPNQDEGTQSTDTPNESTSQETSSSNSTGGASSDASTLKQKFVGVWNELCLPTNEVTLSTWRLTDGKLVLETDLYNKGIRKGTRLTDAIETNFEVLDARSGLVRVSMDWRNRERNQQEQRELTYKITNDTRQLIDLKIGGKLVVRNGRIVETNQPISPVQVIKCNDQQVAQIIPAPYVPKDREAAWDSFIKSKATEIVEYDEKSTEVAKKSKTKWKSFTQKDAMSGTQSVIVRTEGKVGSGSYTADLTCRSGVNPYIRLEFNLQNLRPPIRRLAPGATMMVSDGRERVNGKVIPTGFLQDAKFGNVFSIKVQNVFEGRFAQTDKFGFTVDGKWKKVRLYNDHKNYEDCQNATGNSCFTDVLKDRVGPLSYVYDSAYELTTNAGAIFLEVPPGNAAIKKLIASCSLVSANTSSTKPTEIKGNTSLANMDPRLVNFLGTWGGTTERVLGTCKNEPVKISAEGIQVGKDRYPIIFDSETDITLMDGATALRTQDKNTLIFFDSDGVEHEMKKCK